MLYIAFYQLDRNNVINIQFDKKSQKLKTPQKIRKKQYKTLQLQLYNNKCPFKRKLMILNLNYHEHK